jgi:methylmalonyl-CoA/ethylmalonyl-CoA epimerase
MQLCRIENLGSKMMAKVQRIDHIAVLTDNLENALRFWREALGMELGGIEDVAAEKSLVAFLPTGGSEIELVQPTTGDSGLARYLEKRGPGMHHVCLEVDDIDGMLANLKDKNVQLINESAVTGLGGRRYAFIHPKATGGVLVELYEIRKTTASGA